MSRNCFKVFSTSKAIFTNSFFAGFGSALIRTKNCFRMFFVKKFFLASRTVSYRLSPCFKFSFIIALLFVSCHLFSLKSYALSNLWPDNDQRVDGSVDTVDELDGFINTLSLDIRERLLSTDGETVKIGTNWTAAGFTAADLGTVTTADINGGTWLGTIDGAWTAASQTCADLGTVTTADIDGGTLDNVIVGGSTASAGTFTNIIGSGTATFNDSSNATVSQIDNGGTGHGLEIIVNGVQATSKYGLSVSSDVAQVSSYLVYINQDNASSSQEPLVIRNDGSGNTIVGEGNENLSNAGVWVDRTSFFADKENLSALNTSELVTKLKNMNLYRYQKKCEIYGNKRKDKVEITEEKYDKKNKTHKKRKGKFYKEIGEDKFGTEIIYPNAKEYVGLILDDPTTPEELISRDLEGSINGKSGTQIAEFLLGVCKQLISEIDNLKSRILVLETP